MPVDASQRENIAVRHTSAKALPTPTGDAAVEPPGMACINFKAQALRSFTPERSMARFQWGKCSSLVVRMRVGTYPLDVFEPQRAQHPHR